MGGYIQDQMTYVLTGVKEGHGVTLRES
jgi:hypothetical protein